MGCTFSSGRNGDLNARVFRVYNVDDQGQELNPGKIEVSDTELILAQRGKEAIRWPLRCLRRYGFDAELFSFESGRRCPTGAGIYAFKCRNAEALFNTVQDCIQRAGQDLDNRVGHGLLPSSRPNSRPQSMADPVPQTDMEDWRTGRLDSVNSNDSGHHYINSTVNNDLHEYINTGSGPRQANGIVDNASALLSFLHNGPLPPADPEPPQVTYAVLDLESTENLAEHLDENCCGVEVGRESGAGGGGRNSGVGAMGAVGVDDIGVLSLDGEGGGAACPMYVNVGSDGPTAVREKPVQNGSAFARPKSEPNYANLDLPESVSPPKARHKEVVKVNYIQLDLKNQFVESVNNGASVSPTSPTSFGSFPESPGRKAVERERESYALIDFNKTAALSNTAKNVDDSRVEPGVRKTRHNSVIKDM